MIDLEIGSADLGPLAWVSEELRKSLDSATKALRRFSREAEALRGSDLAAVDTSQLRIARTQIHQALGALEMVGLDSAAIMLRAMEAAVQAFVTKPTTCTDKAVNAVESASFAVMEYLDASIAGRSVSSVSLFPQYREVQSLAGNAQVHPAELWGQPWRWLDIAPAITTWPEALTYGEVARGRLDHAVLGVMRGHPADGGATLGDVALGLSAGESRPQAKAFWQIVAGFAQALTAGLVAVDIYVKRCLPVIVSQYVSLMKSDAAAQEKAARDLLFFCAQAEHAEALPEGQAAVLKALRQAYKLTHHRSVNYEQSVYGSFDPAVLAQGRKRLSGAKDVWGAYSGGDRQKAKACRDQIGLVCDSLLKLHLPSEGLAKTFLATVQASTQVGQTPSAEVAMEVATTILYLEAMFEDFDPADLRLSERTLELASRLEVVQSGAASPPLTPWMEDLYHRFSEKGTLGSVVGELRSSLSELEKALDVFFRDTSQNAALTDVPSRLMQMRGVLTVLGIDQASQAIARMRDWVEQILAGQIAPEDGSAKGGVFEKIGNSLGALGFLIDMLGYQPNLAKKLFTFDQVSGELSPIMGRVGTFSSGVGTLAAVADAFVNPNDVALTDSASLPFVEIASSSAVVPVEPVRVELPKEDAQDIEEDDLLDIFLEEAREVMGHAKQALVTLRLHPSDMEVRTTLRRAFHTLKGSSRMVGLATFGEASWAMEQAHNASLAEPGPISGDLLELSEQALSALEDWIGVIERGGLDAQQPAAEPFNASADALRLSGQLIPLRTSEPVLVSPSLVIDQAVPEPEVEISFDLGSVASTPPTQPMALEASPANELAPREVESVDFSFDIDSPQPVPTGAQADVEFDLPDTSDIEVTEGVDEPEVTALVESEELVENIKVIGDLKINLALYNVYLSEADEWSRRLQAEISELELESQRKPSEYCVAWAHSLAGSSATVGFDSLSHLGREFEAVLMHAQKQTWQSPQTVALFIETADEIRRVLHQFAAGFLSEVSPGLMARLQEYQHSTEEPMAQPEVTELDADASDMLASEFMSEPVAQLPINDAAFVETFDALASPEGQVLRQDLLEPVAVAPVLQALQSEDDDIDAVDAIDPDLFPIFEEEALELLPSLGAALRQWSMRVDNVGARTEALRLMHTIKGSARLAGALRMGEMIHRMESEVEHLGRDVRSSDIEPLVAEFDRVSGVFEALRAHDASAYQAAIDDATYQQEHAPAPSAMQAAALVSTALPRVFAPGTALKVHTPAALVVKQNTQTVRVKAQLLDRLVNQAGEVMMTRSRLEAEVGNLRGSLSDLTGNLEKLRLQLRDIELQAESQMQSRMALAKEAQANFDPLEFDRFTRVQELTRMMAESVNDVGTVQRNLQRTLQDTEDDLIDQARQTRELQRGLLRTRMVEFEGISERLYRVVRLASKETGKQVRLDITGGNIEMDRGMLDRMTPAFEHLLRNCVAHGVEDAQVRVKAGKDPVGLITIGLSHEGNDVTVEFRDDGAGLNLARIREKAIGRGLMPAQAEMTEALAGDLIFMPGFSTASEVTELAGRGIGMDVVRSDVYALGGRIETTTQTGKGSAFKLVLPLTTAVTQVVLIRSGDLVVGVPSTMVEIVRRASPKELEMAYNSGQLDVGQGQTVGFYWSGALLQASARSVEPVGRTTPLAIFRSAAQRVAVHVDEVLGNQEVVVKNLGAQLSRLPGLAGMTLLPSGAVVLIYNPVALATIYGDQARALGADHAQPHVLGDRLVTERAHLPAVPVVAKSNVAPLVLVVDDSITVRKVTQRLLQREGYRVALAADGLQALERLQEELPTVVLSDIEMPRMDGFDLARNIRGDAKMKHLPIVMITSRIAEKHREHAISLGVNHYLGKPYSEEELLSLVKRYCAEEAVA